MHLVIESLTHSFNGKKPHIALENLSLEVQPGQFVAVIGPSGCGKSTLLRLIANLLRPASGWISLDGASPSEAVAGRRIAWMSQSPALLPWLTVERNVALALRYHTLDTHPRLTPVEALRRVGLGDVLRDYPETLSGGMQQRLALARTLIMDADLWLMDEPFASLDELTREHLTFELLELWEPLRPMVLWVTHNLGEALRLADRVIILSPSPGRLVADVDVDLPRPRQDSAEEFLTLLQQLRVQLGSSMRKGIQNE
jgi:NitT/TauT family transport system ATP-binding protein